jgi:hypothetical protein
LIIQRGAASDSCNSGKPALALAPLRSNQLAAALKNVKLKLTLKLFQTLRTTPVLALQFLLVVKMIYASIRSEMLVFSSLILRNRIHVVA